MLQVPHSGWVMSLTLWRTTDGLWRLSQERAFTVESQGLDQAMPNSHFVIAVGHIGLPLLFLAGRRSLLFGGLASYRGLCNAFLADGVLAPAPVCAWACWALLSGAF